MSPPSYAQEFYRELDNTAEVSARIVVPILLELFPITSVVDVGCGDGGWLSEFSRNGVEKILGLDGPWIDISLLKIEPECFRRVQLDSALGVEERFDLAMSLEVAEHLPPARAHGFVQELCDLAPVVLFSAAIPGQGGHLHYNEQWPAYWAERFGSRGYHALDPLRSRIWQHPDVTWWYKQNLLLFADDTALSKHENLRDLPRFDESGPMPLVHPECFEGVVKHAQPRLGRWLKQGPAALRRSLRKRARR